MEKDTPKLHGWITPEYAEQMIIDMVQWLHKNGYKLSFDYFDCDTFDYEIVGIVKNAPI